MSIWEWGTATTMFLHSFISLCAKSLSPPMHGLVRAMQSDSMQHPDRS